MIGDDGFRHSVKAVDFHREALGKLLRREVCRESQKRGVFVVHFCCLGVRLFVKVMYASFSYL